MSVGESHPQGSQVDRAGYDVQGDPRAAAKSSHPRWTPDVAPSLPTIPSSSSPFSGPGSERD